MARSVLGSARLTLVESATRRSHPTTPMRSAGRMGYSANRGLINALNVLLRLGRVPIDGARGARECSRS